MFEALGRELGRRKNSATPRTRGPASEIRSSGFEVLMPGDDSRHSEPADSEEASAESQANSAESQANSASPPLLNTSAPNAANSLPHSGGDGQLEGDLRPDQLRDLVMRSQRGDHQAFTILIERHRGVATAKAYGTLGDVHLTMDALQEAHFKTWQKLSSLTQPERFSGWFLQVVKNAALDVARRRGRVTGREKGWEELPGEDRTGPRVAAGADAMMQGEKGERIRAAIRSLPPEYREVIFLKHAEGRSYREIARLLRTTVKAVESRLFRARQQLSKFLEEGENSAGKGPR